MRSVQQRFLVLLIAGLMMGGGIALLIWALGNNLDGFKLPQDLQAEGWLWAIKSLWGAVFKSGHCKRLAIQLAANLS